MPVSRLCNVVRYFLAVIRKQQSSLLLAMCSVIILLPELLLAPVVLGLSGISEMA